MVINLYIEIEDPQGMKINCKFVDQKSNEVVATATNNLGEHTTLYFEGNKYEIVNYPKKMERLMLNTKYPLCSKRKWTVGFNVMANEKHIASYYQEAITCGKRWIFKKNIGLTVIKYDNVPNLLYRVGFQKENGHYYCLHNNFNDTIGIIKRLYGNDIRATLYVEDISNLLINLIACTEEIVDVGLYGSKEDRIDPSVGKYVSVLVEEKEMFDKSFIEKCENY